MVSRTKDLNNPPAALLDTKWDALKASVLIEKNNHEVNSKCYRDCTLNELTTLYKNKCAICERERGYESEIDHYRPRKARNSTINAEFNQPGYYWLCYEWSNLLPLCSKCNSHKSNKFPLMGYTESKRIKSHTYHLGVSLFDPTDFAKLQEFELPLLVNPEFESTPGRHFTFTRDGKIKGRTIQGSATIRICKLNRKDLRRERLKAKESLIDDIKSAFDTYRLSDKSAESEGVFKGELLSVFKRLNKGIDKDHVFSLLHFYMSRYFDYFIANRLPQQLREKVSKYYSDYKRFELNKPSQL